MRLAGSAGITWTRPRLWPSSCERSSSFASAAAYADWTTRSAGRRPCRTHWRSRQCSPADAIDEKCIDNVRGQVVGTEPEQVVELRAGRDIEQVGPIDCKWRQDIDSHIRDACVIFLGIN